MLLLLCSSGFGPLVVSIVDAVFSSPLNDKQASRPQAVVLIYFGMHPNPGEAKTCDVVITRSTPNLAE